MATSSSNRGDTILLNPGTLEKLCGDVVRKHPDLERELYKANPHNLDYKYSYERYIDEMYRIIEWRHIRDERSFEKWFRKMVKEHIELMEYHRDRKKISSVNFIAESLETKLLKFKKLFGMPLEVFHNVQNMQCHISRIL